MFKFFRPQSKSTRALDKGFSVIEILIYIFILVILLGVIMNVVISVVSSGRVVKSLRNIDNAALGSLERITREVRQADSVSLGSSVLNVHPGRLFLDGVDELDNPRTIEFYLSSGQLVFAENGMEIGALTQVDTRVTNLVFRHFPGTNSDLIGIEMTIESGTSTHYRSNNFYSSTVLR